MISRKKNKYYYSFLFFLFAIIYCEGKENSNYAFSESTDTIDFVSSLDYYSNISTYKTKRAYLENTIELINTITEDSSICIINAPIISNFRNNFDILSIDGVLYFDSILSIDLVPVRLLGLLNSYLVSEYLKEEEEEPHVYTYDCKYPAKDIYDNNWNTRIPNPYPADFADNDSLINIKLVNDISDFHKPGDGHVTSSFGWRSRGWHSGIDLAVFHWHPIHAVFPGVVRLARTFGGYGRIVIIRHDNGLETYYAHLSRIHVRPGQRVNPGDVIGTSGNSGNSNGTHLHFEVRYKGIPINPAHIICFRNYELRHEKIILKRQNNTFFVFTEEAILYRVQRGDYLYKIAQEYGTTVARICDTNDINRRATLRVGQIIKIYL